MWGEDVLTSVWSDGDLCNLFAWDASFAKVSSLQVDKSYCCLRITEKIACDLDDVLFMSVDAVVRAMDPFCKNLNIFCYTKKVDALKTITIITPQVLQD